MPRLGKVGGRAPAKAAKAVHAAIFGSTDPDRLIALARAYPGWAGLCYLMAGLLATPRAATCAPPNCSSAAC